MRVSEKRALFLFPGDAHGAHEPLLAGSKLPLQVLDLRGEGDQVHVGGFVQLLERGHGRGILLAKADLQPPTHTHNETLLRQRGGMEESKE